MIPFALRRSIFPASLLVASLLAASYNGAAPPSGRGTARESGGVAGQEIEVAGV